MRRVFAAALALASTVGFGAATVHAESYPPGGPDIAVPNSTPEPGDTFDVDLDGYCPNDVVNLVLSGPDGDIDLGTVTVDGSGTASFPFTAPDKAGSYTIAGTGTDCPSYVASIGIVVSVDIPHAGSDSQSGLMLGAGAVGIGALLVGVAAVRRRRPAAA